MSATIRETREAIAATLKAALGKDFQVSAYALVQRTSPSITVTPKSVGYDVAFNDDSVDVTFTVSAFAAAISDIGAQQLLDELLEKTGDNSLYRILLADPTLGGVVDNLTIASATGQQDVIAAAGSGSAGVPGVLCEWDVEVYT